MPRHVSNQLRRCTCSGAADFPLAQPLAIVRRAEIQDRADRHDAVRIDRRVAAKIMLADVVHVHGCGHAGHLGNIVQQAVEIRIVDDALPVALEGVASENGKNRTLSVH